MSPLHNFCISLIALLLAPAAAHFYLNYPTSIGFDDGLEGEAPHGDFSVNFATDNVTNYHVGGDNLAMV
jgi:hypothetical protein